MVGWNRSKNPTGENNADGAEGRENVYVYIINLMGVNVIGKLMPNWERRELIGQTLSLSGAMPWSDLNRRHHALAASSSSLPFISLLSRCKGIPSAILQLLGKKWPQMCPLEARRSSLLRTCIPRIFPRRASGKLKHLSSANEGAPCLLIVPLTREDCLQATGTRASCWTVCSSTVASCSPPRRSTSALMMTLTGARLPTL